MNAHHGDSRAFVHAGDAELHELGRIDECRREAAPYPHLLILIRRHLRAELLGDVISGELAGLLPDVLRDGDLVGRRPGRAPIGAGGASDFAAPWAKIKTRSFHVALGGVNVVAMPTPTDRISAFHQLHASGCFVMPNPWDAGSARLLAQLGFPALATTSAGLAWSLGVPDTHVGRDKVLAHLRSVSAAVDVPVNADFEDGFAIDPEGVAISVELATRTGISGLSIEDSSDDPSSPLFDFALAVERVAAARRAIDESGTGIMLTARSEGFISRRPDLAETIRRLTAFAAAGADCLYAPGVRSIADIKAIVDAVSPKPVNVLVSGDFTTVSELADVGVRRISVGGALARTAWTGFMESAKEIAEQGTFSGLSRAMPGIDLDGMFER